MTRERGEQAVAPLLTMSEAELHLQKLKTLPLFTTRDRAELLTELDAQRADRARLLAENAALRGQLIAAEKHVEIVNEANLEFLHDKNTLACDLDEQRERADAAEARVQVLQAWVQRMKQPDAQRYAVEPHPEHINGYREALSDFEDALAETAASSQGAGE